MELYIEEWEWDQANLDHLAARGITVDLVEDAIWSESPRYNANRKGRTASHFMIGPDRNGAIWTICILQVSVDPATWRAITGWKSKAHEVQWYRRAK